MLFVYTIEYVLEEVLDIASKDWESAIIIYFKVETKFTEEVLIIAVFSWYCTV